MEYEEIEVVGMEYEKLFNGERHYSMRLCRDRKGRDAIGSHANEV